MNRIPARARGAARLALPAFLALVAVAFLIAFAARPAVILSIAGLDDALFARLGRSLAEGRWLGRYDETILVKGPGFPAFLAVVHLFGLAYPLAVGLFHLAASAAAGLVTRRVLGSRLAGAAAFVLLLLLPPLYFGDALRVTREAFYTSLTLALVAVAIALAADPRARRPWMAALAGLLLGWFWLTREEGVWLVPSLLLLALTPQLVREEGGARPTLRRRAGLAAPFGAAAAGAAAIVVGFGLVNWAVYGRFVVNEIKDPVFQGALDALQEAAWPHHRELVPVPAPARAEIYRVSPAFAELREPALDPPGGSTWTPHGCAMDRRMCGDIGGGWFFWAVRSAAAGKGHHGSPDEAAAFYARLEREVRAACEAGRLRCIDWHAPMIPPTRAEQLDDIGASLRRTFQVTTLGAPPWTDPLPSDLGAMDAAAMQAFLGSPSYVTPTVGRRFHGWFIDQGARWFELAPGEGVEVRAFQRLESPDLVTHYGDAALQRQRFNLDVVCPRAACPVELRLEGGGRIQKDLNTLATGPQEAGGARLFVDAAEADTPQRYLKDRFSGRWTRFAAGLGPFYRLLFLAGAAGYLALLAQAALRRRITAPLVICTALAGAVAARIVILALIDALSFPAAAPTYAMPAAPLLVLFAVFGLHAGVGLARRRRL